MDGWYVKHWEYMLPFNLWKVYRIYTSTGWWAPETRCASSRSRAQRSRARGTFCSEATSCSSTPLWSRSCRSACRAAASEARESSSAPVPASGRIAGASRATGSSLRTRNRGIWCCTSGRRRIRGRGRRECASAFAHCTHSHCVLVSHWTAHSHAVMRYPMNRWLLIRYLSITRNSVLLSRNICERRTVHELNCWFDRFYCIQYPLCN